MSSVNWAGSVSEVLPRHSLVRKNVRVSIREAGLARGYRDFSATETKRFLPNSFDFLIQNGVM